MKRSWFSPKHKLFRLTDLFLFCFHAFYYLSQNTCNHVCGVGFVLSRYVGSVQRHILSKNVPHVSCVCHLIAAVTTGVSVSG